MSEFIDVEWFGREQSIGIVLTYDQFDGFKCRMAPVSGENEKTDAHFVMSQGAKIPFAWAWGIWGKRMIGEWENRHLDDGSATTVRYDHRDYDIKTLQEIK